MQGAAAVPLATMNHPSSPASDAGMDAPSRPILVYGPRKAGTSLLQNLLDGGSQLLMVPGELKLKAFTRKGRHASNDIERVFLQRGRSMFKAMLDFSDFGQPGLKSEFRFSGLKREELEGLVDLESYVRQLGEMARTPGLGLRDALDADAAAFQSAIRMAPRPSGRWASKEVGGLPARIIGLFHRCYPEGMVVLLVRQPEFVVRSVILDRRRKGKPLGPRRLLRECHDVQRVITYCARHGASIGRIVVRYEDLTRSPEPVVRSICEAVGIAFEPVMTRPTTLGRTVVVDTSSRPTATVFKQESNWRKDLRALEIWVIWTYFRLLGPLAALLRGRRFVRYSRFSAAVPDLAS